MNKIKLLYINIKQNKWINKYTITLVIFGISIIFFDSNSLIARYKAYREKQRLSKEIAEYKKQIEKDQALLEAIESDSKVLEQFAREEYKMKAPNEDVYIINEE